MSIIFYYKLYLCFDFTMGSVLKQTVIEWLKTDFLKKALIRVRQIYKTLALTFMDMASKTNLDFAFLTVHRKLN